MCVVSLYSMYIIIYLIIIKRKIPVIGLCLSKAVAIEQNPELEA